MMRGLSMHIGPTIIVKDVVLPQRRNTTRPNRSACSYSPFPRMVPDISMQNARDRDIAANPGRILFSFDK